MINLKSMLDLVFLALESEERILQFFAKEVGGSRPALVTAISLALIAIENDDCLPGQSPEGP